MRLSELIRVHKRAFFVPVILSLLMMIIVIFSQMSMEICTYGFILGENIKRNKSCDIGQNIIVQKIADVEKPTVIKVVENTSVFYLDKPINGGITTSEYGDTVSRKAKHLGHDWAVKTGTKVMAAADGIVEKAYFSDSYGYNVLINHENGTKTRYAHLSAISIKTGERVKQRQCIGLSGNTGDSTGPHLHFEVIINGKRVAPLDYIKQK